MRLNGKIALITGGTSGIGAATAEMFLQEGAKVVVSDLVAGEIAAETARAEFIKLDVTREEDWIDAVATIQSRFGGIDILVNSAGRSSQVSGDPLGLDGWDGIMNVNATGVFLGMKHVAPVMQKAGGGSIINISSIMAYVGGEGGHPGYHASKGAVRSMSKTFAVRYGRDGVRVNSVYPGFLPPMRTGRPLPADVLSKFIDWTPLGRIGAPRDIAAGVTFLASADASFITGAELVIDGGFVSR